MKWWKHFSWKQLTSSNNIANFKCFGEEIECFAVGTIRRSISISGYSCTILVTIYKIRSQGPNCFGGIAYSLVQSMQFQSIDVLDEGIVNNTQHVMVGM